MKHTAFSKAKGADVYFCDEHRLVFETQTHRNAHNIQYHSDVYDLSCLACHRYFKLKAGIKQHYTKAHKYTEDVITMEYDLDGVKGSLLYLSEIKCKKAYEKVKDEGGTVEQVTFECQIEGCDKITLTEFQLSVHMRVHEPNRNTCGNCGTSFPIENDLVTHVADCTNEEKATFICTAGDGCEASYTLHAALVEHLKYSPIHGNDDIKCFKC